jgi:peroxiredoxin Q/BCP
MKSLIAVLVGSWVLSLTAVAGEPEGAPGVGDAAPAFSLVGSDGQTYELTGFKGRKAVVLAWFPKAFTGG